MIVFIPAGETLQDDARLQANKLLSQTVRPTSVCFVITNGSEEPPVFHEESFRTRTLPCGTKIGTALHFASKIDEDVFAIVLPGAELPANFLESADKAMSNDIGIAAYSSAKAPGSPRIVTAPEFRDTYAASPLVPQATVFRRSVIDQIDPLLGWNKTDDVCLAGHAICSANFRTMIETFCAAYVPNTSQAIKKLAISRRTAIFEELKDDYCAYTGTSPSESSSLVHTVPVLESAKKFNQIMLAKNCPDIDEQSDRVKEALRAFYSETDAYLFELFHWHYYRYWDGWWTLSRFIRGKFLEYGGGIGTMCCFAARHNVAEMDYFDISEKLSKFAAFRFEKRNVRAKILPVMKSPAFHESITDKYDTICAIDVIEHIPDWKDATRYLVERLNPKGLFIQNTNFGRTTTHPMHYNSDVSMPDFLRSLGLRLVFDKYREYDGLIWEKPK